MKRIITTLTLISLLVPGASVFAQSDSPKSGGTVTTSSTVSVKPKKTSDIRKEVDAAISKHDVAIKSLGNELRTVIRTNEKIVGNQKSSIADRIKAMISYQSELQKFGDQIRGIESKINTDASAVRLANSTVSGIESLVKDRVTSKSRSLEKIKTDLAARLGNTTVNIKSGQ